MSKWTEETTTECGHTVFVHEDWDGPPKFCKECKEANDAKWHEKKCIDCGQSFFVHEDWENPPKRCKECKNKFQDTTLSCTICDTSFTWSAGSQRKAEENGWEQPKKCLDCRKFIKENMDTEVLCKYCPNTIKWSSFQQLMELHKDWAKPTVCRQCKEDRFLLIQGALSDFSEKVYVKDEQPIGSEKRIAVVYRAKDGQELAHISIGNKFGEGRVAITGLLHDTLVPDQRRHTKIKSKFGEGRFAQTYGNKKDTNQTSVEKKVFEKPTVTRKKVR